MVPLEVLFYIIRPLQDLLHLALVVPGWIVDVIWAAKGLLGIGAVAVNASSPWRWTSSLSLLKGGASAMWVVAHGF